MVWLRFESIYLLTKLNIAFLSRLIALTTVIDSCIMSYDIGAMYVGLGWVSRQEFYVGCVGLDWGVGGLG